MLNIILVFVQYDLQISIEQAPIVDAYTKIMFTNEQTEDAFWKLFLKSK
jgi:hypothetical protein